MIDYLSNAFPVLVAFAEAEPALGQARMDLLGYHLAAALVFSLVGIAVLFIAILLMEKLTRFSITKEIVDEHNTALAIIVGSIVLGISMIVAASILG